MPPLPKLLVSSVVRGANQGDSHGGVYIVDLENETFEQRVDWNDCGIDFGGRGADRGLRGIVVHRDEIFVAASDELFVFDRNFKVVGSYRNPYLKHCHEISEHRGSLYLTSTGFDSILRFDLATRRFNLGLQLLDTAGRFSTRIYDPLATGGPAPSVQFHLNSVYANDSGIFVCGLKLPALVRMTPQSVDAVAELPSGTHNARPFRNGVLLNDTEADSLVLFLPDRLISIPVPKYAREDLLNAEADESGVARQGFGRGLCVISETLVAGGSSPTTVSLYDLSKEQRMKSVNITMDMRNAAHGMAIWPF